MAMAMAADDCNSPPSDGEFDPFAGMDSDNINYVHSVAYDEVRALLTSLPPGWRRLDPAEMEPGNRPPYLHEPSGATSWKNPNLENLMKAADAHEERKRKGRDASASDKRVKKLRLMLQAGAPLGAVEQKARLEGIDMSLVLSPSDDKKEENAMVSEDEEEGEASAAAIPETLVKKYKRMIKAGVPLDRVQQLAGVEAGASPEQVASIVQGGSGGNDDKKAATDSPANPRMVKFLRMQKAGIPLPRLQGHDMKELNEALGVESVDDTAAKDEGEAKDEKTASVNRRMSKFLRMQTAGVPLPAIQNAARLQGHDLKELNAALGIEGGVDVDAKGRGGVGGENCDNKVGPTVPAKDKPFVSPHFTLGDGKVSFSSSRGGEAKFPLTDLVRKMVQTVQKTSQFDLGSRSDIVVGMSTLYHALGALKGVQFARDEYNSTIGATDMDKDLIHSKRHGFVEMATSIGMAMSNDVTKADIQGLDDLIDHIKSSQQTELDRGRALLEDDFYDFDSIHTLYEPGTLVVAKHAGGSGIDCFCQVVWHRYTQGKTISGKLMKYFQLCCRFIVPVGGGKSTFAEVVEGIEMFEGRRSLSASASGAGLSFVPALQHELQGLLKRYNLRGEMFNRITSVDNDNTHRYMEYEKGCFFQKSGGGSFNAGKSSVALAMPGRIVVDFDAASDNGHTISVGRDDLIDGMRMKFKEYKLHLRSMADKIGSNAKSEASGAVSAGGMVLFSKVPEEYLSLVWPTAVGFSLTSKSWGDVAIDGLKGITFDQDVFEHLVLPDSRKRMIKALVKHTSASGFHDVIQGKGEGTVFLLHGLPGTGKTLTAEAIAETLQRPLYSVSMGTLGTTADELERRLSEILQLSARWDALVLLDEADSFLEARSPNSPIERNAMVSVMLRLVEYHRGILFLTSNRVDTLDPAFMTRITLALRYEPLDLTGRAKVWENLLVKSGETLDSLNVVNLAKTELNGRDIKNALRLAMALAAEEGDILSQELLLETAAVVHGHKDTVNTGSNGDKPISTGWLSSWWG